MTVTVLDSADLVESVTTGVIPVPKGIAEDNASQAAKREAAKEPAKGETAQTHKVESNGGEKPADKVAETITATDPEPDDIEGEDGLTPRQKRDFTASMQKTIAKKHRLQRDAEEFAAGQYNQTQLAEQRAVELARENADLKARLTPQQQPKVEEVKAPVRADFQTEEAYQDAAIDFRVDQRMQKQAAEEATRREEQHKAEVVAHAIAKVERARELVPDFNEVTGKVDAIVPEFVGSYMQESDMMAELGYHFAKHPEVLQKLSEFTANVKPGTQEYSKAVTRQLVEVGKIESTLRPFASPADKNGTPEPSQKNGEEPSTKTGTSPSKPRVQAPIIRPLNAGSSAQVGKSAEEMNTSETITAWQRKNGTTLTARKRH